MTDRPPSPAGRESAPRLLKGRLLRGCNIYYRSTVFSQRLDPGSLAGLRIRDAGPRFASRVIRRFGGLKCGTPGGCLPEPTRALLQSKPGLRLTRVLLEATLAVERFVAAAMARLDRPEYARLLEHDRLVELVWEAHAAWSSRAAVCAAFAGVIELLPRRLRGGITPAPDFATAVATLRRQCRRRQWSSTSAALALAAKHRGLPHELLAGAYVRVGEGAMQQVVSESALGDVGVEAVLDLVFPAGVSATIPTALIVGQRGTRAVARALDRLLRTTRDGVGLATHRETTIQGRPVGRSSLGRGGGPRFLLSDPRVATAVIAVSPRRMVRRGLRFDRSSVTALLDPVPRGDKDLYRAAMEIGLKAATDAVVVSADNPYTERVLKAVGPSRVLLVTRRRKHPLALRQMAAEGSVLMPARRRRGTALVLWRGGNRIALMELPAPASGGKSERPRRLEVALFTAALACGLGVSVPPTALASRQSRATMATAAESPDARNASRSGGSSP